MLFALGTPVIDYMIRFPSSDIGANGLEKGVSNFRPMASIERIISENEVIVSYPGDNSRNLCEGLSSLNSPCVYYGAIGSDDEAKFLSDIVTEYGIPHVFTELDGRTGKIATLISEDVDRTFVVNMGVATTIDSLSDEARRKFDSSDYFYTTSITHFAEDSIARLSSELLEKSKMANKKLVFALESSTLCKLKKKEILALISRYEPLLFGNERELNAIGGVAEVHKLIPLVVCKQGANGASIYRQGNEPIFVKALKTRVADTTGAGDYFNAGFLHGLMDGKSIEESGKLGAALAAKCLSLYGARLK